MARAAQDRALADGHGAATVAVYGALVRTADHLLGGDADLAGFPEDPVLQAAIAEVPNATIAWMGEWLLQHAELLVDAGAVLASLDELEDVFPVIPPGADAYRRAAEQLVLDDGHCAAAVAWAGTEAAFEFVRLYTDQEPDLHGLLARDAVANAAFRELTDDQIRGVRAWVRENWERIDELATAVA